MGKTTYKGLVPPDDPMFKEGWTVISLNSSVDDNHRDLDYLNRIELSWVSLHSLFYVNSIKSELSKDLEKELGVERISSNYSMLDDDEKIEFSMACMNVLVECSPTVSEVSNLRGKSIEPAIKIRGVKSCFFFEYLGRNYGPFDSIKEVLLGIEKGLSPID